MLFMNNTRIKYGGINLKKMGAKLLYVEDDQSLGFVTRDNLEIHGYEITHSIDGISAMEQIKTNSFDLFILDVMLPGIDGFQLAEAIRKKDPEVPILFLTAKSLKDDRIKGLKLGGDDYITKPFSIEELILKIEIFLKRSKFSNPGVYQKIKLSTYIFDYPNLLLLREDKQKRLTQKEADLLHYFANNKGQVVKRSAILEKLWGQDDYFMGRSLDVFISRLRKYLKEDENLRIENIHGVGFKFVE